MTHEISSLENDDLDYPSVGGDRQLHFSCLEIDGAKVCIREVPFVIVTLATCAWGLSWVQKRRERRRLESTRDSALW